MVTALDARRLHDEARAERERARALGQLALSHAEEERMRSRGLRDRAAAERQRARRQGELSIWARQSARRARYSRLNPVLSLQDGGVAEATPPATDVLLAQPTAEAVIRFLFAIGLHAASAQAMNPSPQVREKLEAVVREADTAIRELRAGLIEADGPQTFDARRDKANSAQRLRIEVVPDGASRPVVQLTGNLDLDWVNDVLAGVDGVSSWTFLIDLSELTSLDSAGVEALVAARKAVEQNGNRLQIRGTQNWHIREAFEFCGFGHLLDY